MTDAGPALLSVVTVVRNDPTGLAATEESLRRALQVDASADNRVEWIIVDGSDSPVPPSTLQGLATRFVPQPPAGIFEAMNLGLSEASGEWIYFLNAGDALADNEALNRLLGALGRTQRSWGFARVRFFDSQGRAISEPAWEYARQRQARFARGRFPPHQGTVVKTDVLRGIGGFDTRFRITADYHAALRLSLIGDPEIWPWTLADFTQGGASSAHWRQALREMHQARREVFSPRGWSAVVEHTDTIAQFLSSAVARVPTSMRR